MSNDSYALLVVLALTAFLIIFLLSKILPGPEFYKGLLSPFGIRLKTAIFYLVIGLIALKMGSSYQGLDWEEYFPWVGFWAAIFFTTDIYSLFKDKAS